MRLRNCFGMIWSVSTLGRSSGAAVEVRTLMGCMLFRLLRIIELPVANVGEVAGDSGCCCHLRADEVSAASTALSAFEVAVAGAGATFSGGEDVGIHAEAHAAAGFAPVEACCSEDFIEAFLFSLRFDGL